MKSEHIARAFDLVAPDEEAKARMWEKACQKQKKSGVGRKLAWSVIAAAAVFCLVFFGGPLLKGENKEELFTATAYALSEMEDGALWFTEAGMASDRPDYWGGYVDCETRTLYVGIDFGLSNTELSNVEVHTDNGFFVQQYVGDLPRKYLSDDLSFQEASEFSPDDTGLEWLNYSGSMRSGYKLFMTSAELENVGSTITFDQERLDDYLFFWACHYDYPDEDLTTFSSLFPDELCFQAKAALADGKTVEQEIVVDLSAEGTISINSTLEQNTGDSMALAAHNELLGKISLDECLLDEERTYRLTYGDTFEYPGADPDCHLIFTINDETPDLLDTFGGTLRISSYLPVDGNDGHYVILNSNGNGTFSVFTYIIPGEVILRYYEGGEVSKSSVYVQSETHPAEGVR